MLKKLLIAAAILTGFSLTMGRKGFADTLNSFAIAIQQGGTAKGAATIFNCDGTTTTCTVSGAKVTLAAVSGGAGLNQLTQDVTAGPGTGSQVATVVGVNAVGLCSGFSPTNGQFFKYTTGGSPNPCWSSGTASGGGTFSAAPPYYYDGTNYYVAATGYTATKPTGSPTWINGFTPSTATAGTNGDYLFAGTGTYWQTQTATTSVEAELQIAAFNDSQSGQSGVWLYDSTNGVIWFWGPGFSNNNPGLPEIVLLKYTYSGTGNPAFSAATVFSGFSSFVHLKIIKSGGTASFQLSLNGGKNFYTVTTQSVGTIAQGGTGGSESITDVYSLVVT